MPETMQQVLSAGLHGGAQHFRIGSDEVGRRQSIGELARIERQLVARGRVKITGAGDLLQQPLAGQQITLAYQVEGRQLPVFGAEPAIGGRSGRTGSRRHLARQRTHATLPQLRVSRPRVWPAPAAAAPDPPTGTG